MSVREYFVLVFALAAISSCAPRFEGQPLECTSIEMSGAEMLRRADVVVHGTVSEWKLTGRKRYGFLYPRGVEVLFREAVLSVTGATVMKGKLPGPTAGAPEFQYFYWGVFDLASTGPERGPRRGPAIVPLVIEGDRLRSVQDCCVPSIRLRRTTGTPSNVTENSFDESVVDVLFSLAPDDSDWPNASNGIEISNDLLGGLRTIERLSSLAVGSTRSGEIACSYLCRWYGQCKCAEVHLNRSDVIDPKLLRDAIHFNANQVASLEACLRRKEWDRLITKTRAKTKADALDVLGANDSPVIRRMVQAARR